jgi:hypothetical protein
MNFFPIETIPNVKILNPKNGDNPERKNPKFSGLYPESFENYNSPIGEVRLGFGLVRLGLVRLG